MRFYPQLKLMEAVEQRAAFVTARTGQLNPSQFLRGFRVGAGDCHRAQALAFLNRSLKLPVQLGFDLQRRPIIAAGLKPKLFCEIIIF